MANHSDRITDQNHRIAETNLAKKYEVENVFWASSEAKPDSTDAKRIELMGGNGRFVTVSYRIDPETNEPFLMDEPEGVRAFAETRVEELVKH